MYYNTTNEEGSELLNSRTKTLTQDELILEIYQIHEEHDIDRFGLSPEVVRWTCEEFYGKNWPITSIRRSINTLTKSGKLTKTSRLKKGPYGKREHLWKLATQARTDINDTNTPGQGGDRF